MESEKVKEIKNWLENESEVYRNEIAYNTLDLINEMESENENLSAIVKAQKYCVTPKHCLEVKTLKDRIAELKEYIKGNEQDAKAFVNGWHKDLETELKQFAERLKEKFNDTEYRAKTKRKTISVEELKAQMDWLLHEVVIKNIDEILKEFI